MSQVRRSSLLPIAVLGAGSCLLASVFSGSETQSFLTASPAATRHGRTAMHGFKDDFSTWKSTLSADEQALILKQAQGEFNKKFRKSDDFSKDIASDKIESFAKVLKKFFDSEREDYKKDKETKTPDYNVLQRKAQQKTYDFSLKQRIVEVNRDADRRYMFATEKARMAEAKGEKFPSASPLQEIWLIQNNDTESHQRAMEVMDFIAKAKDGAQPESAKMMDDLIKKGVPAVGQDFELLLPQVLVAQTTAAQQMLNDRLQQYAEHHSEAEVTEFKQKQLPEIWGKVLAELISKHIIARDEVEKDAQDLKKFFRSQKDMPGKTKADILKGIWAELPKHTDKPVPPLDEEMLAELAKEPAIIKGEFKHSWGTADKLYKSEAIDSFGEKYLLGVFETKAEAQTAFVNWNAEYEKARDDMKDEMTQWGKSEQARLDADPADQERIQKALEEARR
ncbi:unnamed protein product [Polarella glacialis]|uniref:Uncharacterized protein n=1 Tax=Polarella glacialis TaxID=89957 RepID=A0A813KPG5_POLGL|nr:unnamed protein product [Polarella glacialis]